MSLQLPAPIAAYFAADRQDAAAVAQCFTPDAVVKDEGHLHRGRDAIRAWKAGASSKYNYTSEPISLREEAGRVFVIAHVAGDFHGSPVDLTYAFMLEDDLIAALGIGL